MDSKKRILITGSTGTMGQASLSHLSKRLDKFKITAFVKPTSTDKKIISKYQGINGIEIVYGDITNFNDVYDYVKNADIIIHLAAIIPPLSLYNADLAMKVNYEGTVNVIKAIKSCPEPDKKKLVFIGTIAETGERKPPYHFGRVGDPIKPNIYDFYGISKVKAEREVIESGLKYWVSLRQTAIAHYGIMSIVDGLVFHQPLYNCMEWVTAHDSGLLIANLCEENFSEDFWHKIYNVGGGESCRVTFYEMMQKIYGLIRKEDITKLFDLNWFATKNFEGQWYEDSYILNDYLNFRTQTIDDFLNELKEHLPFSVKLGKYMSYGLLKQFGLKPLSMSRNSPYYWVKINHEKRIKAFYGSKEEFEKIGTWKDFEYKKPSNTPIRLDHGYDESKPFTSLTLADIKGAAEFRGGKCLCETMNTGDVYQKLKWQCAFGHKFEASPFLILKGGFWCPECEPIPWNYGEQAKRNKFLAQIWYKMRSVDDCEIYEEDYFNVP